ncbi:mucin-2-like isoform X1 [Cololabis saira]|uniref:mucin-2-like isoform X1 n=1 Tax=Cololabis saira TaxID=129043 RepID=UPI002AD2A970|nr:mucin-2-like isoform X1 [Cololabis saira]
MEEDEMEMSKKELRRWIRDQIVSHIPAIEEKHISLCWKEVEKIEEQTSSIVKLDQSVAACEEAAKELYSLMGWEYRDSDSDDGDEPTGCGRTRLLHYDLSRCQAHSSPTSHSSAQWTAPTDRDNHDTQDRNGTSGHNSPPTSTREPVVVLTKTSESQLIQALRPPSPQPDINEKETSSIAESSMQRESENNTSDSDLSLSGFNTGSSKRRKLNSNVTVKRNHPTARKSGSWAKRRTTSNVLPSSPSPESTPSKLEAMKARQASPNTDSETDIKKATTPRLKTTKTAAQSTTAKMTTPPSTTTKTRTPLSNGTNQKTAQSTTTKTTPLSNTTKTTPLSTTTKTTPPSNPDSNVESEAVETPAPDPDAPPDINEEETSSSAESSMQRESENNTSDSDLSLSAFNTGSSKRRKLNSNVTVKRIHPTARKSGSWAKRRTTSNFLPSSPSPESTPSKLEAMKARQASPNADSETDIKKATTPQLKMTKTTAQSTTAKMTTPPSTTTKTRTPPSTTTKTTPLSTTTKTTPLSNGTNQKTAQSNTTKTTTPPSNPDSNVESEAVETPAPDPDAPPDINEEGTSSSAESSMQWETDDNLSDSDFSPSEFNTGSSKRRKLTVKRNHPTARKSGSWAKRKTRANVLPSSPSPESTPSKFEAMKARQASPNADSETDIRKATTPRLKTTKTTAQSTTAKMTTPLSHTTKTTPLSTTTKTTPLSNGTNQKTAQSNTTKTTTPLSTTAKTTTTPSNPDSNVERDPDAQEVTPVNRQSSGATKTPPSVPQAKLRVNMTVLARRRPLTWQLGKITEIITKEDGRIKYKVTFKENERSLVSSHHIAFHYCARIEQLSIGARVVIQHRTESLQYQPGIVAELPSRMNRMRFLIFIDDHTSVYTGLPSLHVICKPLPDPLEDIHEENHRNFITNYLKQWPNPTKVCYKVGSNVNVEYNGVQQTGEITTVDCSLVKVNFKSDQHDEWIYRGSPCLQFKYAAKGSSK